MDAANGKYLAFLSDWKIWITYFSIGKIRIINKVKGWKEKFLSQADREIMIKVFCIPMYTMLVFLVPGIIQHIKAQIRNFWWGLGKNGQSGMIWRGWKHLCCPKDQGGIGFQDLHAFNLAQLAKQAWKVITKPRSLLSPSVKGQIFPYGAAAKMGISYIWRSLLQGFQLVRHGLRWWVGDELSINA